MSDTKNNGDNNATANAKPAPIAARKSGRGSAIGLMLLLILLLAGFAGGFIYIEHRLTQQSATIQQAQFAQNTQHRAHQPIAVKFETMPKRLDALEKQITSLSQTQAEQTTITPQQNQEYEEIIANLQQNLTQMQEAQKLQTQTISALQEDVSKRTGDLALAKTAPIFKALFIFKASLHTPKAASALSILEKKLAALSITPSQLQQHARIAEHIAKLHSLLEKPSASSPALQAQLFKIVQAVAHKNAAPKKAGAKKKSTAKKEAITKKAAKESAGFFAKFQQFFDRHVQVERADQAALKQAIKTLKAHAAQGEFMAASAVIDGLETPPKSWIKWQNAAQQSHAIDQIMQQLEADISTLLTPSGV
jgi:hypothetical protein